MRCRILNTEGARYGPEAAALLRAAGTVHDRSLSSRQLREAVAGYHVLIVGLGTRVDRKVIERGKDLRIIATATTGTDHIDAPFAVRRGIRVVSLKGERLFLDTVTSTAEFAFFLMGALLRRIPSGFDRVKGRRWDRGTSHGFELRGKTLGLIGLGRLGTMMARYGRAFGMKVIAADPKVPAAAMRRLGVGRRPLQRLLQEADIVSLHASLTEASEGLIGAREFSLMKPGALLVNTARGRLVDEHALLAALRSGAVGGAALDVLADENRFARRVPRHPLVAYARRSDNLIITPHIAGMAADAVERTRTFVARRIVEALQGGTRHA